MLAGGGALAAEHAGDLGNAFGSGDAFDVGKGASGDDFLFDHVMCSGGGGDRCEVGDAEDLTLLRDLTHLFAHHRCSFAADIGVDFVKDQHRNLILRCQNRLQRQHHAGHFAGRGDGSERTRWFSGIWSELKFHDVEAAAGWRAIGRRGQGDIEVALLEA